MTLTKEEMDVLKILVQKELDHVTKDAKKLMISNAPFFGGSGKSNLPFLKSEVAYQQFLKDLLKKL